MFVRNFIFLVFLFICKLLSRCLFRRRSCRKTFWSRLVAGWALMRSTGFSLIPSSRTITQIFVLYTCNLVPFFPPLPCRRYRCPAGTFRLSAVLLSVFPFNDTLGCESPTKSQFYRAVEWLRELLVERQLKWIVQMSLVILSADSFIIFVWEWVTEFDGYANPVQPQRPEKEVQWVRWRRSFLDV